MEIIDLGALRNRAGLTQAQVAAELNLSQSQISRYEAEPDEAPQKLVRAWAALCGDAQMSSGIRLRENKRLKIDAVLDDLAGWFRYAPETKSEDLPDLRGFLTSIKTIAGKPRVAVAGQFDSGKSTMLNFLLGGKSLPVAYQPTTSLVCLIRHISDKPTWQVEPAAILSKKFELSAPDDKENFEASKLFVGNYDILHAYAQHPERLAPQDRPAVKIDDAAFAVVYLDSSILEAGDFIDLPGYSNNEEDSKRAEIGSTIFDALIYMSTVNGFLDERDCTYLPTLIDKLNPVNVAGKCVPLANLFLVCSQVHSITSTETESRVERLGKLLESATDRVYPALSGALSSAEKRLGAKIHKKTLRNRMFGFAVDSSTAEIADVYINDLTAYLGSSAPQSTYADLVEVLKAGRKSGVERIGEVAKHLETGLTDRDKAAGEVKEMIAKKDSSKAQFEHEKKRLVVAIDESLEKTKSAVDEVYSRRVNAEAVEKLIRDSYEDKKTAEKYIPTMVLDGLKREVDEAVVEISASFNKEVSAVLNKLSGDLSPKGVSTPFDVQTAFVSALTGAGAVGALAGWAAVVAGGSNLGGYILAAKMVGWLTAMGIQVGSPTVVMSTIAAMGGPITIALGVGLLLATSLWALLRSDWQTRMAKKIVETFDKQNIKGQYSQGLQSYWNETKNGLESAMEGTIKAFDKYIADRQKDLDIDVEQIKERIDEAKRAEGFLRSMPDFPKSI